jgi:tetratricopeptide (TPR) repeat protein
MNEVDEARARELFDDLCDLSARERERALARSAADEPQLAAYLRRLLAADGDGSFLETPALGAGFRLTDVAHEAPPERADRLPMHVGNYLALERIGRGGMGVVYRARQESPRREVALKVLRADVSRTRLQRYLLLEAEVLGRLTHPGIAQIHESGTAELGGGEVAYLAMELVEGVDLVQHARAAALDRRARMRLLIQVCRAVHFVHGKGVIHRDVKPGNVLVDGAGRPKVVDFGLARVNDVDDTLASLHDDRRIAGTLPYMSPEHFHAGDVDAVSDVYSLGVTAYELLTGTLPFELDGLELPEALNLVANGAPRPIRAAAPDLEADLCAVVEMATAREKERRYRSADALADDLERWVEGRAVLARSPRWPERLARAARRHRVLVAASGVVLATLVAAVVGMSLEAGRALRQADLALKVKTYLQDRLRSAGDPRTDGQALDVVHVLERAAADLDATFGDEPELRAELADTIGMGFYENGELARAERLVREARDWRAAVLDARDPRALASANNLGIVLIGLGRHVEAQELLQLALDGRAATLGEEHEDTQRTANWLGLLLLERGAPEESERVFERSLEIRRRTLGEQVPATLATRHNLARALRRRGAFEDAERALRDVLAAQRRAPDPAGFALYETTNSLGSLLFILGRHEEAEALLVEALEGYRRLRGAEHPETVVVAANLASVRGTLDVAEEVARQVDRHPRDYIFLAAGANRKFYDGRREEAERDLRLAILALEARRGHEFHVAGAKQSLAGILVESGRAEHAVQLQRDVLREHAAAGTSASQLACLARSNLSEALRQLGRGEEALREARAGYEGLAATAGESALYTIGARLALAECLAELARADDALGHARSAVASAEGALAPSFAALFRVKAGRVLMKAGAPREAERELLRAHEVLLEIHGPGGYGTRKACEVLARLCDEAGRAREAAEWRARIAAPGAGPSTPPAAALDER